MNYENMSDFEINKLVADAAFAEDAIITKNVNGYPPKFINDEKGKKAFYEIDKMLNPEKYKDSVINIRSRGMSFLRDYCNNPSDAWPIILDNEISIEKNSKNTDFWRAVTWEQINGCEFKPINQHSDKNPLRAAIIVYLMMQEAKC